MKIEDIYKLVDVVMAKQKEFRHSSNFIGLLTNAEALLEQLPTLIDYSVTQESDYRKIEAILSDVMVAPDKRNSSAYCEVKAKSSDSYKNWQKSKLFIELIYEMIQISKKLASSVNKEFNAN